MSIFSQTYRFFSKLTRVSRGFTLVEMLVVSAIILVITTFILFRQAQFDSTTLLRSLAYSGALSVRQAQVYGTSIRETTLGSGVFARRYGVYASAGTTDSYLLFADLDLDGEYDSGETVNTFRIGKGYSLGRICGLTASASTLNCDLTWLTIYFTRPNTDALFKSSQSGEAYSAAFIEFMSEGASTRAIKITSTGQISVCPRDVTDLAAECP